VEEHYPSKLVVTGSSPVRETVEKYNAPIAQVEEHLTTDQGVRVQILLGVLLED